MCDARNSNFSRKQQMCYPYHKVGIILYLQQIQNDIMNKYINIYKYIRYQNIHTYIIGK